MGARASAAITEAKLCFASLSRKTGLGGGRHPSLNFFDQGPCAGISCKTGNLPGSFMWLPQRFRVVSSVFPDRPVVTADSHLHVSSHLQAILKGLSGPQSLVAGTSCSCVKGAFPLREVRRL